MTQSLLTADRFEVNVRGAGNGIIHIECRADTREPIDEARALLNHTIGELVPETCITANSGGPCWRLRCMINTDQMASLVYRMAWGQ